MPDNQPSIDRVVLRKELLRNPGVQRLLRQPNWKPAAEAAIRFYLDGTPSSAPGWTKTSTWQQVCTAYHETKTRLEGQSAATSQTSIAPPRGTTAPVTEGNFTGKEAKQPQAVSVAASAATTVNAKEKGPSAVWVVAIATNSVLAVIIGRQHQVPLWLLLVAVGGFAGALLQHYTYACRYGSWSAGQAALRKEAERRREAERQAKWDAYYADCRNFTPEERYWRRFWQRQARYSLMRWLRKR
jgi:hypothetical protein